MSVIKNMAEVHDILRVQKVEKPRIEDVIPKYLDGDIKKDALNFAVYLLENKMKLAWAVTNGWKVMHKGKVIGYIRLPMYESHFRNLKQVEETDWKESWVFTPYLHNLSKYEDLVIAQNLKEFVLNGLHYCVPCLHRFCATERTIFGNKTKNLCLGDLYGGMALWYVNPKEAEISCLKKLLEFEIQARACQKS